MASSLLEGRLEIVKRPARRREFLPQRSTTSRQRFDEYFTVLREVERDLQREQTWADKPKPDLVEMQLLMDGRITPLRMVFALPPKLSAPLQATAQPPPPTNTPAAGTGTAAP
jgi:hypothetical protein